MARQKGMEACSILRGRLRCLMKVAQTGFGEILLQGRRPKLEADVERLNVCFTLIQ